MRAKAIVVLGLCAGLAFCASAQAKIQKAREKDPKYQYNLGLFYLNQNSVDEAVRYFVKALSLETRYYLAWNGLGLAHSMRGRLDESVKAYQKCLEVNPQFTEARNNLGTVYQEMKLLDKAEEEFKKALLDLNYQNRELPYFNLARLYVLQGRLDDAYDNVQKSLQIQPRLAMGHNLKGIILEKRDNLSEAITSYEQAVKIVPEEVLFNYNLAVAYFKNSEFVRSRGIFTRILPRISDPEMINTINSYLTGSPENKKSEVISTGSGIFMNTKGVVATSAHVVKDYNNIEIMVFSEKGESKYSAKILLADNNNDVALLQIVDEKFNLSAPIPYEFVETAEPGESVFTIGYPLSDVMGTKEKVSNGIISAISGIGDDIRFLQVQVPLQPGNSGGPLFNKDGNVVGLISHRLNQNAVGERVEHVNYAIKASYLINIYKMLPNLSKLPTLNNLGSKALQDQIRILKNYVCLIKAT